MKNEKDICLVVGAGISHPPPSCLPLFKEIRKNLLNAIEFKLSDEKLVERIAPEVLLSYLSYDNIDVNKILYNFLNRGEPNALHKVIAFLILEKNIKVWTPNVDELIEKCANNNIVRFIGKKIQDRQQICLTSANLYKLHGTISKPESMIFKINEVLEYMDDELREHMIRTFMGKDILVAGYAGADPDLRPALHEAFKKARKVIWFDFEPQINEIRRSYFGLSNLELIACKSGETPSILLYNELINRFPCVKESINEADVIELHKKCRRNYDNKLPKIHSSLLKGMIYEKLTMYNDALKSYANIDYLHPKRAIKQIWKYHTISFYQGRSKKIRKIISFMANIYLRTNIRWLLWFAYREAAINDLEGKFQKSLKLSCKMYDNVKTATYAVMVAAAARKAGKYDLAISHAREAIELAQEKNKECSENVESAPKDLVLPRAYYELAYSLRLGGTYREAIEAIKEGELFTNIGGPRWDAWHKCQEGCILTQAEKSVDKALDCLKDSRLTFNQLGDLRRVAIVDVNICTAYRKFGDIDKAKKSLAKAKNYWNNQAYKLILEIEAIKFEEAELFRIEGKSQESIILYKELIKSIFPVHRILGNLGLSTIDSLGKRRLNYALQAYCASHRIGFNFGVAHALFSLWRLFQIADWETIKEEISKLEIFDYEIKKNSFIIGKTKHGIFFPS